MINITLAEANEVAAERRNGYVEGISASKGGRVWLEGEFTLSDLEALCVIIRAEAGEHAQGAEELVAHWRAEGMMDDQNGGD